MTKDETISFLKDSAKAVEEQIGDLKEKLKVADKRVEASLHGALNDAEMMLAKHRHQIKELTGV